MGLKQKLKKMIKLSVQKLKEIIVSPGFITEIKFDQAAEEAAETNLPLEEVLVNKSLIADEDLGQIVAAELNFRYVNLSLEGIDEEIFSIIPENVAKKQLAMLFARNKTGLKIAMNDPGDLDFISLIEKKTGEKITAYYASKRDLKEAFDVYRKDLLEQYETLIKESILKAQKTGSKDFPIIKIVDTILEYAYRNKASDVHFEPRRTKVTVRFRIDGVLHEMLELPREIYESLVTRMKVLSKLRTDEHFAAQDGKISRLFNGSEIDLRVSIVPITTGEKVVLRLLAERSREYTLESLGLNKKDYETMSRAIRKPWGMILATGPTGCGKTTTLYSIVKILNSPEVNISTIEDPVEYSIENVNQIQVNLRTQLTFAKGLRSIVRQDPDVIMIGEIRDEETADIAINSALTGHLVLSTLHTNDASTTLPRLLDMNVEPFLIASTVNVALAQRLVRKICFKCRASEELSLKKTKEIKAQLAPYYQKVLQKFLRKGHLTIYQGRGCRACQRTGYSGRTAIFEVLEITEEIKSLIMQRANAAKIQEKAIQQGMITMVEAGLQKVLAGETTLEEVLRVTRG